MEKLITHTGIGVPPYRSNVDTDQIIPAIYLKHITRTGFENALFAAWHNDPKFVLSQDACKNGSVLIAGPNFSTDSSHKHAVWALKDYGFRVVLAPKFADIFRRNSGKQGLVTGIISQEDCVSLWKLLKTEPGTEVTVSLEDKTWRASAISGTLQIDDYVRWTPIENLDDVALTLHHEDGIAAYEAAHPPFKPCMLPTESLPKEEVVSAHD